MDLFDFKNFGRTIKNCRVAHNFSVVWLFISIRLGLRIRFGRVLDPSFACSIWAILNANKETKQIVFIYRLFSCPGPEHEPKKGTNICPMSERRKVCKTALTNTYTGPILLTLWPLVWECVGAHTYTRTCLYEGHDDNCAESILLAAVLVAVESRGRTKWKTKRKIAQQHRTTINAVDKSKSYQLHWQFVVLFVQERPLFLFKLWPCGPG